MGSVEEPRFLQTAGSQSPGGQWRPQSREGAQARAAGTELPGCEHRPTQHPAVSGDQAASLRFGLPSSTSSETGR